MGRRAVNINKNVCFSRVDGKYIRRVQLWQAVCACYFIPVNNNKVQQLATLSLINARASLPRYLHIWSTWWRGPVGSPHSVWLSNNAPPPVSAVAPHQQYRVAATLPSTETAPLFLDTKSFIPAAKFWLVIISAAPTVRTSVPPRLTAICSAARRGDHAPTLPCYLLFPASHATLIRGNMSLKNHTKWHVLCLYWKDKFLPYHRLLCWIDNAYWGTLMISCLDFRF